MRTIFHVLIFINIYFCQAQKVVSTDNLSLKKEVTPQNGYGWTERFAFFAGIGTAVSDHTVYNNPVIDPQTKNVIINGDKALKTSFTLGIVYTPWVYNITRKVRVIDEKSQIKEFSIIEHVPRKITFAAFFNPINLNSNSENLSNVDVGFGIGWREGDFLALATVDFLNINQPRDYFIENYRNNDQKLIIDSQIQTSIDTNDNRIFHKVLMPFYGIKVCYTFDLIKSFKTSSDNLKVITNK